MRQDIDLRTIWNEAAKSGLVLGIFTAVFMFTGILTAGLASGGFGARLAGSLISVALWLVKFVGCLWLLRFFMLKFAVNHPELTILRHRYRREDITRSSRQWYSA